MAEASRGTTSSNLPSVLSAMCLLRLERALAQGWPSPRRCAATHLCQDRRMPATVCCERQRHGRQPCPRGLWQPATNLAQPAVANQPARAISVQRLTQHSKEEAACPKEVSGNLPDRWAKSK